MDFLNFYKDKLERTLERYPCLSGPLTQLEKKTNVKKVYLAAGFIGLLTLWLMFGYGAQLLCNFIGFVYPAYCSVKAIESKSKDDDVQWLMYWVVFSIFSVCEFFSDILVGWVPFYWLAKCLFLVWCMSPLDGSTLLYKKLVVPMFNKSRTAIDNVVNRGNDLASEAIEKAKAGALEAESKKSE